MRQVSGSDLSIEGLRAAMPGGGLFADKDWLMAPEPFGLSKKQGKELSRLGHRLRLFQEASDLIYRRSVDGKVEP